MHPSAAATGCCSFACLCKVAESVAVVTLQWLASELNSWQSLSLVCNMVSDTAICSLYLCEKYDQRALSLVQIGSVVTGAGEFGMMES